ncbi:MAG TPA: ABC transporter permease, partial [Gemmatimonadales bacterium]|nr:ABC transporter permease [Gemmatimonadales bacterium]
MLNDLRLALRSLRRSPGFAFVVVLTLALGIGANTAIFSVLYGVLLRPLPYPAPERVVGLVEDYQGQRYEIGVTYREFRYLALASPVFESFAATTSVGLNLFSGTEGVRVRGLRVSSGYFKTLGIEPALGRSFLPEEDQPGTSAPVILSHELWQRRFGGDPAVLNHVVTLDGQSALVVGIMPEGFYSPEGAEVWSTLAQVATTIGSGQNLEVVARLKPGVSMAAARAEMAPVLRGFQGQFKPQLPRDVGMDLEGYRRLVVGDDQAPIELLFGAIGLVLLIACANVANLLLSRGAARSRELAVRAAIGASRGRLLRQMVTESLVIAFLGGALGLLFAAWGLDALLALVPGSLPRAGAIHLDGWALLFTFAVCLLTGLGFGLLPAWQSTRSALHESLKESAGRTSASKSQGRLRHALVELEVALSLVLLVGAGLLIRTFANLVHTEPGFEAGHVVSAEIWLAGSKYDSTAAIGGFYSELVRRSGALPGVKAAAVIEAGLPLMRGGNIAAVINGDLEHHRSVDYRTVTPGFFDALGVGIKEGRGISDRDQAGGAQIAVVNQAYVKRYLDKGPALGSRIALDDGSVVREVVGVVGDVRSFIGSPAQPTVFIPSAQTPEAYTRIFSGWYPIHLVVRTDGDPAVVQGQLARLIHEVDRQVPVGRVQTMNEVLAASLGMERFLMLLLT